MTDAGIPMGEGRDVPRWLCPSCFYGVADPVVNGRGRCPCTPREQELIDQAERPDPKVLSDRLAQFLAPEACLNGTPMVPLHRSTIYRIVRALDAADTPPPAAAGDREAIDQGCRIPPAGWWCSRERGHEGPCAARQEDRPTGAGWSKSPTEEAGHDERLTEDELAALGLGVSEWAYKHLAKGYAVSLTVREIKHLIAALRTPEPDSGGEASDA